MTLRPFVNLLAVRREDPREREEVAGSLRADRAYHRVDVWPAGWVVAVAPLPHGPPESTHAPSDGLYFAEGREAVGVADGELARRIASEPERLATVPGDFTVLHVDQSGRLTAARSAGGRVPLYWLRDAVATRFSSLLPFVPPPLELDPLPNAVAAAGYPALPGDRSFIRGLRILGRGRFRTFTPAGGREGVWWDPRPDTLQPPTDARRRAHAERLRTVLLEALEADLDPSGGNLLALSGGIDSTSLLCLAAGTLGLPVSALSLMPPEGPLREHEMAFIRTAAARGPLERHWIRQVGPRERLEMGRAARDPGFPVPHPVLQALPEVAADAPVRVLVGGEFGDEVGGSHFTLPDWVSLTPFRRLLAGDLPYGPQDVGRWIRRRIEMARGRYRLHVPDVLPAWFRPEVREEYRDWLSGLRAGLRADPGPLWHLALRASGDGWLPMNWEACSALGVRKSLPFFNRAALELAFDCHPGELVGPGVRRLTRTALRDDVPRENLLRSDKGQWRLTDPGTTEWTVPLPAALEGVVQASWMTRPPGRIDLATALRLVHLDRFVRSIGLGG